MSKHKFRGDIKVKYIDGYFKREMMGIKEKSLIIR